MPAGRVALLAIVGIVGLVVVGFLWQSLGGAGPLIVLLLLVLGAIWLLVAYNDVKTAHQQARLAEANLDAALKARFESLPRLEEYLQSFTTFSQEVLNRLAAAREHYGIAQDTTKRWENYVTVMNIIVENYPSLNPQQQLHSQLMTLLAQWIGDVDILAARRDYNKAVNAYNVKISMFPGNVVAAIFGFKEMPLLEAGPEERGMPASRIRLG